MHRFIGVALSVGCMATAQSAVSDQVLAQASGCMTCHQTEAKLVGPSYKDVAAKYKGDAAAKEVLMAKVRTGGVGTWGQIPMPANTTLSDSDLATLIDWVLSQ